MSAPRETLHWALQAFAEDRLALVSAFGPGSLVLIHLLSALHARVPIVFIDTLYHFPETLELVERVRTRFDIDLRVYRPAVNRETFEAEHGPRLWERDLDRYQHLTKVEPFRRAVAQFDAYISGRRRDQSPTRATLDAVERGHPYRINPLASWTREQVWTYIRVYDLPYNVLHDRGYTSIGDAPLTTAVKDDEHERAGRWRGLDRLECGIHTPPLTRSAS